MSESLEAIFREEAEQSLQRLSQGLLRLEGARGDEERAPLYRELFRTAHSLKGAASAVGRTDIGRVAHALESCLERLREAAGAPPAETLDLALHATDLLMRGIERPLDPAELEPAVRALENVSTPLPSVSAGPAGDSLQRLVQLLSGMARGNTPPSHAAEALRLLLEVDRRGGSPRTVRGAALLRALLERPLQRAAPLHERVMQTALLAIDFLITEGAGQGSDEELSAIEEMVGALGGELPAAAPTPVPGAEDASAAGDQAGAAVRVPVRILDGVQFRLDEVVATRLRLDQQRRQLEECQEVLGRGLTAARAGDRAGLEQIDGLRARFESLRTHLSEELHLLGTLAHALQEEIKEVRMVPAGPSLESLRRAARDVARALGKELTFEVGGGDVRVDRRLLERMKDPLVHLVRNAVDHGVESPADRLVAGKPRQAKLTVSAESRDAQVWITIEDDGRGIDLAKVRARAVQRGILAPNARLPDADLRNLIFQPGFSTADEVSEVSGRGVGLDVVRQNVAELGGRIELHSVQGQGTRFTLALPLTLAATRGLLVGTGQRTWCLPLAVVEEVLSVERAHVRVAHGRQVIFLRDQAIPFALLDDALGGSSGADLPDKCFGVVLALSDQRVAVGVDRLLSEEEVVVRGLVSGTPPLPFVAGATSRADGRVVTVLDSAALIRAVSGLMAPPPVSAARRKVRVVVADDSLTTRTLISGVLQSAGYEVAVAADGEAALRLVEAERPSLVVSDVEMPRMDGIQLARSVRQNPTTARVPVILVTSLGSAEDRARGAEAGATAYVVKKDFDAPAFLSLVGELLAEGGTA